MHKTKRFLPFLKSLKFRLILLVFFMAMIPGLVIRIGFLQNYETRAVSLRESEVLSQSKILANQIASSDYMSGGRDAENLLQAQIDMLTTIYDGRVMIIDPTFFVIYDSYNLDDRKNIICEEVIKSSTGQEVTNYDSQNHYIEMTFPIIDPEDKESTVLGVMLVSVSTDNIVWNYEYLDHIAWILELIVGVASLFLGVMVVIACMKPFEKITYEISMIQDGYGEDEIKTKSCTEFALIADGINAMRARAKVLDESRQEFVSNVSHELKTPLTSMKVLADSINSMPGAPLELYQEFMGDITNEIERETKIINDLLSLVRMDKAAADLNVTQVHINELLEQILKRLQPIADKQKVELVLESFRPVTADVDEVKMTLVITNLVENAIKYNKNDGTGWVHVTLNADHQFFYLKVEDSGMGIPEESLEHIYERFYRVDKSHSREIGGTGLGLAITRNCILMHRGAIKAHSVLGEGTTFDVRIPLSYIV